MKRADILDAAKDCVMHDRNATHGKPENSFADIAAMWSTYTGHDIKPHDVCAMMALLKIVRIKTSPDRADHWIDIAGYSACGADVVESQPSSNP